MTRTVTPSIPPRVDYELTPRGLTLIGPLMDIGQWAIENREYVESSRMKYDLGNQDSKTLQSLRKRQRSGLPRPPGEMRTFGRAADG